MLRLQLRSKACRSALQRLCTPAAVTPTSTTTNAATCACCCRKDALVVGVGHCRYKSTMPAVQDSVTTADTNFTVLPFQNNNQTSRSHNKKEASMAAAASIMEEQEASSLSLETRTQPGSMKYAGETSIPITSQLSIVTPQQDVPRGIWPAFRMMDEDGVFRDPRFDGTENALVPGTMTSAVSPQNHVGSSFGAHLQKEHPHYALEFEQSVLLRDMGDARSSFAGFADHDEEEKHLPLFLRAHRQMVRLREMDTILLNAQRQGRISFFMQCTGEESIHFGTASALHLQDQVFTQYREQGVLMWRGFSLEQFTNQCFSNDRDLGKGRQMPVHYGSRALNFHTVSSPLGTQIPQAAGAAYRLKLADTGHIVVCFFGEGCASTTDFHSGLNFAATLQAPVVFICRNNGYAISTPTSDQYAGDGVVSRAPGYGMAAIRVDGNDLFAVHAAVREARAYALEHSAPVLVECMTYRQGHHSTSDDSSRYRSPAEVDQAADNHDPLARLENFMMQHGWLTSEESERMHENERLAVLQAMEQAEQRPKPPVLPELFSDVYAELPPHLQEQQEELAQHMAKYPERYAA